MAKVDLALYFEQMQRHGVRRLLILSGEASWCRDQAHGISQDHDGDWLWIADSPPPNYPYCCHKPSAIKTMLGAEYRHAIFDATDSFNAEALAAVAGVLAAGSLLVMLVPPWQTWTARADKDSLRWSEASQPIVTPNFINYFKHIIECDNDVLFWQQGQPFSGQLLAPRTVWQPPRDRPTQQQQAILTRLQQTQRGYFALIADRGRGKSALAGMLAAQWQGEGECWLTAPHPAARHILQRWSNDRCRFFAPDALLAACQSTKPTHVDWLIIDEAAALPSDLLKRLIAFFPRVLMTTTVQGYEGSGRGFLLKLCADLPSFTRLSLQQPIRWADRDPLENVINELLMMTAETCLTDSPGDLQHCVSFTQQRLVNHAALLPQFYGLLISAHYRTSPLDLRRLMDAPKQSFFVGLDEKKAVIAALWLVEEGGLSLELSREIWAGRRRPHGNLVAQSLAAHGGEYLAPSLRSFRISRIAVIASRRRQGIARTLVEKQIEFARQQKQDYLSVSFGYTETLWQFWQACGFELIHMGNRKEASSGCYSAMAIVPFSMPAKALVRRAKRRFLINELLFNVNLSPIVAILPTDLNDNDWRELAGFAFAHRTLNASQASLFRLLRYQQVECKILRLFLEQRVSEQTLIDRFQLSGRKALIAQWRNEVAAGLLILNAAQCARWQRWVLAHVPVTYDEV